jgi:Xaa-Pro dipeptidase
MICIHRRDFVRLAALSAGIAIAKPSFSHADAPEPIRSLKPMLDGIKPITDEERKARIEQARRLMAENKIDAVYLEPGSSLYYFSGVPWHNSERMFALIIPQKGELAWVCPAFEEARARELIRFGTDIRVWQEDDSPYKVVAGILKDRAIRTGTVAMEEQTRFFLFDGIRKEAPSLQYVSADPVTAGCRMIKSPAELALMQRANDITIVAYRATAATVHESMTQREFAATNVAAFAALGVEGGCFVSFGK